MTNPFVPPTTDRQPKGIRPMSIGAAFGWALLITSVFLLVFGFILNARPGSKDDEVSGFACQAIAYLLGLFGILRIYGPDASIRDFIGMRGTSWLFFPIVVLLGISTTIFADSLYTVITHRFPYEEGPTLTDVLRAATPVKRVLIASVIALAGPLVEELIFRGALFRPLKKSSGPWVTVIVTAILFTVVHVVWQKFPPLLVLALCMGAMRQWSGSLWVSWTFHATFNGVGVAASFLELRTGQSFDIPDQYQTHAIIASIAATIALVYIASLVADRSKVAAQARTLDA